MDTVTFNWKTEIISVTQTKETTMIKIDRTVEYGYVEVYRLRHFVDTELEQAFDLSFNHWLEDKKGNMIGKKDIGFYDYKIVGSEYDLFYNAALPPNLVKRGIINGFTLRQAYFNGRGKDEETGIRVYDPENSFRYVKPVEWELVSTTDDDGTGIGSVSFNIVDAPAGDPLQIKLMDQDGITVVDWQTAITINQLNAGSYIAVCRVTNADTGEGPAKSQGHKIFFTLGDTSEQA